MGSDKYRRTSDVLSNAIPIGSSVVSCCVKCSRPTQITPDIEIKLYLICFLLLLVVSP